LLLKQHSSTDHYNEERNSRGKLLKCLSLLTI
jgi:hypothetical protein